MGIGAENNSDVVIITRIILDAKIRNSLFRKLKKAFKRLVFVK